MHCWVILAVGLGEGKVGEGCRLAGDLAINMHGNRHRQHARGLHALFGWWSLGGEAGVAIRYCIPISYTTIPASKIDIAQSLQSYLKKE